MYFIGSFLVSWSPHNIPVWKLLYSSFLKEFFYRLLSCLLYFPTGHCVLISVSCLNFFLSQFELNLLLLVNKIDLTNVVLLGIFSPVDDRFNERIHIGYDMNLLVFCQDHSDFKCLKSYGSLFEPCLYQLLGLWYQGVISFRIVPEKPLEEKKSMCVCVIDM